MISLRDGKVHLIILMKVFGLIGTLVSYWSNLDSRNLIKWMVIKCKMIRLRRRQRSRAADLVTRPIKMERNSQASPNRSSIIMSTKRWSLTRSRSSWPRYSWVDSASVWPFYSCSYCTEQAHYWWSSTMICQGSWRSGWMTTMWQTTTEHRSTTPKLKSTIQCTGSTTSCGTATWRRTKTTRSCLGALTSPKNQIIQFRISSFPMRKAS